MEDASLFEVELGDGISLFAVFDGHGGTFKSMQDMKLVNLQKLDTSTFCLNCQPINKVDMRQRWMSLLG